MTSRTLIAMGCILALTGGVQADEQAETLKITAQYQGNVEKGLAWLAKQQAADGHWEAQGGAYPIAMTALAGMALLAEGSTIHQGKYAQNIEKAVNYLMNKAKTNNHGLISNLREPQEQRRYMYGHGFSTMFLAQIYGEENDERRREELQKILSKAVEFTGKAQTKRGGWGYVTAADSEDDFDEGSVTITQVQALRAARDSGIPVPKEIIERATVYLKKSTIITKPHEDPKKEEGGVIYSLRNAERGAAGRERKALTVAAIACMFNAGEYDSDLAMKWLNYCQQNIGVSEESRSIGQWEYMHFYYAQVMYCLGEKRHAKLRPDLGDEQLLKWSRYRAEAYKYIATRQAGDGSWNSGYIGPVYTTAMNLVILQLDKGALPILSR
jgi:hypothetical protein